MPTSPIKSHPSTKIIEMTIAYIKRQLPNAPILIMADGVKTEQENYRSDYEEYLDRLEAWSVGKNIRIKRFPLFQHQTGMIRKVLRDRDIKTTKLLFIEHDFPVIGDIPWQDISEIIDFKLADLVRFYLETDLEPAHNHLFLDRKAFMIGNVPVIRTGQWSQRPHIASLEFYTKAMKLIPNSTRYFIEDSIHGFFGQNFDNLREKAWNRARMCIYYPPGNISRCKHLDGREDDVKW